MTVVSAGSALKVDALQDAKLQALEAVYEKTNRILSGNPLVTTRFVIPGDDRMAKVPGWTDGRLISVNRPMVFGDMKGNKKVDINKTLLAASGVNYHELSHVIFTPRLDSWIAKACQNENIFRALNCLEDQRAESFFVQAYRPASKFFTALVVKWLGETKQQWMSNYALVYGRRFLPRDIVVEFKKRFAAQNLLGEIEDVIDEYRSLVIDSSDLDTQKRPLELVREYNRLLQEATGDPPPLTNGEHGGHRAGRESAKTQEKLAEKVAEEDFFTDSDEEPDEDSEGASAVAEDEDGADDEAGGDAIDVEDDEDDDEESFDESSGSGDAEGEGEDEDGLASGGSAGSESDDAIDSSDGAGGSRGGRDEDGTVEDADADDYDLDDDELLDRLSEAEEDIASAEEVEEYIDRQRKVLSTPPASWRPTANPIDGVKHTLTQDDRSVLNRLDSKMEAIRVGTEPRWDRRQPAGKLNVQAAMNRRPGDFNVFDKYVPGLDGSEGGLEVVICVDRSGSMAPGDLRRASFAMYALKRSFATIDAQVTCLTFDDDANIVYTADQRVASYSSYTSPHRGGGTAAAAALVQAANIFAVSQQGLKLLVMLTDGGFNPPYTQYPYMLNAIHEYGVLTVLLGINQAASAYNRFYGFKIARDVEDTKMLLEATDEIAEELIRARYEDASGGGSLDA